MSFQLQKIGIKLSTDESDSLVDDENNIFTEFNNRIDIALCKHNVEVQEKLLKLQTLQEQTVESMKTILATLNFTSKSGEHFHIDPEMSTLITGEMGCEDPDISFSTPKMTDLEFENMLRTGALNDMNVVQMPDDNEEDDGACKVPKKGKKKKKK